MTTRFLLDKVQLEEEQTIKRILQLSQKSAYPDRNTTHLASFIDSCFEVISIKHQEKQYKRKIALQLKELKQKEQKRESVEKQRLESIEIAAPVPTAPQNLEKREYVLNIYKNPIGILVEKNSYGKHEYHIVEPHINPEIIFNLRPFVEKIGKKPELIDSFGLVTKEIEKAYEKAKEKFDEHSVFKTNYFLKRDGLGAGLIDPLIYDENVQEIYIDGNKSIEVTFSNYGKIKTNKRYKVNEDINNLIKKLGKATKHKVNEDDPVLDVTLEGLKIQGSLGVGGVSPRLTIKRL
jgi:hypothetical protein